MGLTGSIDAEDFKQLINGQLPTTGEQFRKSTAAWGKTQTGRKAQERAGIDLTFSAPKSVTLQALVMGDDRLFEAHQKAVERTLEIVERRYATTRIQEGGSERKVVTTGNLVAGLFQHDTSRDLDPHLHTHCVLLNMTRARNRWYSLHNDSLYRNKKLLGQIYQNELAIEVQKLGYKIETREHGQFEIAGFSREAIKAFSKRRMAMMANVSADASWEEKEAIWSQTRRTKEPQLDRLELQSVWRHEARAVGLEFPIPEDLRSTSLNTAIASGKGTAFEERARGSDASN